MKLKDYLIIIGGVIALLVFIVFMVKFSNERKEIETIDKQIQADTILIQNHQKLNSDIHIQSRRITRLENRVDSLENDVLRIDTTQKNSIRLDGIIYYF